MPNFSVRRWGYPIGKYFQRVLVTRKRVTKKKHKDLPRQFICEGKGLMNITKIFCQSLGVTSHAKTFLMVCHFRTDSRSNESGIRFNGLGYPFPKKLSSNMQIW